MGGGRLFTCVTLAGTLIAACQVLLDFENPRDPRAGSQNDGGAVVDAPSSPAADADAPGLTNYGYCNDVTAHFAFDDSYASDVGKVAAVLELGALGFSDGHRQGKGIALTDAGQLHVPNARILSTDVGTIGYWIRPSWSSPCPDQARVLLKLQNLVDPIENFAGPQLGCEGTSLRLVVNPPSGGMVVDLNVFEPVLTQNDWHYLAMSWRREPAHLAVSVDGVVLNSTVVPWEPQNAEITQLLLNLPVFPQDATMDELTIWSRVVPESELEAIYRLTQPFAEACGLR